MWRKPGFLITLMVLFALAWLFRPFFHGFVMSFVESPLSLVFWLVLLAGIWSAAKRVGPLKWVQVGTGSYTVRATRPGSGLLLFTYLVVAVVVLAGLSLESEFRYLVTSRSTDYTERSTLPNFTPVRLTPKTVAQRYADDSFQNPQEYLGDSQIALIDNKLQRVFPRLPESGLLYFFNKLTGFVIVDVDTLVRKVEIVDQKFNLAEGIGIFDNIYYQLPLKHYFVKYSSEPIYLKKQDGTWVTVVSYMKYQGFPFTKPVWGGVVVVEQNGTMTDYSPEQAQEIDFLKGNRLYPKELTAFYSHSYAYRGGLINKWFLHRNETEVVSLHGEEAIFHLPSDEGFKQVMVAEPYGRSYGIYKIFIYDATTGKREVINYDQNSQLTGPIAAADYIKKEFPTYDWSSFGLAEPRPITIKGELYWLMSVVPADSAGIATTVLLNTKTNQVLQAKTEADLVAILKGDATTSLPPTAPSPGTPAPNTNEQLRKRIEEIQQQLEDLKKLLPAS